MPSTSSAPSQKSFPAAEPHAPAARLQEARRAATTRSALKYAVLFALLAALLAFYQVADTTFRYVLDTNAPFAASTALSDRSPIPRALLWGSLSQSVCWRLATLSPAATLVLGIAVWCVGAYGLLRALNGTFRLTSGVDWNLGVFTHTYMHTPPLIKAFLIAVTAAVPAIIAWLLLGFAMGDGAVSQWIRLVLVGAATWVLFSSEGVAGDYESGNYELPRERLALYSLLARGAIAGTVATLVARLASAVSPDGLFQFYATLGGIGEGAWRSIVLITCGIAAASGLALGGFVAVLGAARGGPRERLRAAALPLAALLAAVIAGRLVPYVIAHRYDYTHNVTAMAPNGVSFAANHLAREAGIHVGSSGFDTVLLLRPGRTASLNVAHQSIDGLDAGAAAALQVRAFLSRRSYQTALSGPAFRTWHDSASLRWDSVDSLRASYTELTRCPSPEYLRVMLEKLGSAAATDEVRHYADLLADESQFAFPTRESRETMANIFARLGMRNKAEAWYRRAEVPDSRIPELLSARTMFADGRLTGRILLNGGPAVGVRVGLVPVLAVPEAFRSFLAPGLLRPFWLRWVGAVGRTDAAGRFALDHVVAGNYRLVLSTPRVRLAPFSRRLRVENAPRDIFLGYGRKELDIGDVAIYAAAPINPPVDRSELL